MVSKVTGPTFQSFQPEISKIDLGGICLGHLSPQTDKLSIENITAIDLTFNKAVEYVYQLWEKTIKVKVTLLEISDIGYATGKIEWENATYVGVIKKLIIPIKDSDQCHQTVIPYSRHKKCEIAYKDSGKFYSGYLGNEVNNEKSIFTFIGKGSITLKQDIYHDEIGLDFATGDVYPFGFGKYMGNNFIMEGTFFHSYDFIGTQKDLQLYANGKLYLLSGSNCYAGVVQFTSSGYMLVSLPAKGDKFESSSFYNDPMDCEHHRCKVTHYESISTGTIVRKMLFDEEYYFGLDGSTQIFDTEKMLKECRGDFLVDPSSLKVLLTTKDQKSLDLPNLYYYGTFTLEDLGPLGEGMLVIKKSQTTTYHGQVTFSPKGVPKISSFDNKEYQITIKDQPVKVKIGYGNVVKDDGVTNGHFYFDQESNIYPIPKEILSGLKTPPLSPIKKDKQSKAPSPSKRIELFNHLKPVNKLAASKSLIKKDEHKSEEKKSPILVGHLSFGKGKSKLAFQERKPFSLTDLTPGSSNPNQTPQITVTGSSLPDQVPQITVTSSSLPEQTPQITVTGSSLPDQTSDQNSDKSNQ